MANKLVYRCPTPGCDNVVRSPGSRMCPKCGNFVEFVASSPTGSSSSVSATTGKTAATAGFKGNEAIKPDRKALGIKDLVAKPLERTATGIGELDRVLGGGFVKAEVLLFAGHPGAGKSSLSLDIANRFALKGQKVLYTSGEESEQQIGLRARRMGIDSDNIRVINETNLETILGHIEEEQPQFVVVDSLQTLASREIAGSLGSIAQSKEAANVLTSWAKRTGIVMVLINQIVKSGEMAGSESIQHIVDAVVMLESDTDSPLKFLRATKNRFGDTSEVGVFQHGEQGLEEVSDPSGVLMDEQDSDADTSGTSIAFISEGTRQMPVEIQALVVDSNLSSPRRQFSGVNFNRGQIVCAILDKHCRVNIQGSDVFINTVSGVRVSDPQADLSIAASILSSEKGKSFTGRTAFVGELSLTGAVRGKYMMDQKVKEAARLGFDTIVLPSTCRSEVRKNPAIAMKFVSHVSELNSLLNR